MAPIDNDDLDLGGDRHSSQQPLRCLRVSEHGNHDGHQGSHVGWLVVSHRPTLAPSHVGRTVAPAHLRTLAPCEGAPCAYNCFMLIRKAPDLRYSDVTPKSVYLRRREFIQAAAGAAAGAAVALSPFGGARAQAQGRAKLPNVSKVRSARPKRPIRYEDITGYNNFYEFGTDKDDPTARTRRNS